MTFLVFFELTSLLGQGVAMYILISVLAMLIGTALCLCLGWARISTCRTVGVLALGLFQFFRNAPWLVLLFFCMYLLPFKITLVNGSYPFPDWAKATLGFSLPIMANFAEIVRGAIQSIPTTQWQAADSLACSRLQALRYIILPQALNRMSA